MTSKIHLVFFVEIIVEIRILLPFLFDDFLYGVYVFAYSSDAFVLLSRIFLFAHKVVCRNIVLLIVSIANVVVSL